MIERLNYREVYKRITANRPYGKNLKSYSKKIINDTISFYEKNEEYEKCNELLKFIKEKYDHGKRYTNFEL